MADYAPLSITDISNLALQEMGSQSITDIDDTNSPAALACAAAFWQSVRECGRSHNWSCLKKRVSLASLPPPPPGTGGTSFGWNCGQPSTPPPYWLANTAYLGGTLVTYGEAIYYCLMGYTSSNNFINDMTAGYWAQIYSSFFAGSPGNAGEGYEWDFAYALPSDYLLITELNGVSCWDRRGIGSLYEIFIVQTINVGATSNQLALFCNDSYANVKYTALIQDPTMWDPLFIGALAVLLASKIATQIRGDDGALAKSLRARFDQEVLPKAQLKDSGEGKDRRYDPTRDSNFIRSRWGSTAG